LQEFISLVTRHWNATCDTLHSGNVFLPLLLDDESGVARANDWANGFMGGMEMRRGGWAGLMDDEERAGSLVPILALAHEHHPDPEMRTYKEPISAEMRERLIVGAAVGVVAIYDYFEAERVLEARGRGSAATFRREAPKVGRNELCPCGSGKKFPSKTHSIFIDPYDLTMKTACASSENHLNLRIKTYLNGALTSTMAVKQRVSLGHEKS